MTGQHWKAWLEGIKAGAHPLSHIASSHKTLFYHYCVHTILKVWIHLLAIRILAYICPYWTSTCFWFIEVTLTSIPVFWRARIYAFLNLYSMNLISRGQTNKRKHRLTRVIRLAVYGKIKCRFDSIIQNPIWHNVLAVTIFTPRSKIGK